MWGRQAGGMGVGRGRVWPEMKIKRQAGLERWCTVVRCLGMGNHGGFQVKDKQDWTHVLRPDGDGRGEQRKKAEK